MKFAFWKKKDGGHKEADPRAKVPEREPEEPVEALAPSPDAKPEAERIGWSRLQRIAVGAAVLLSAFVIAAPFFVSDRAIEAETAAKTEIPPAPSADPTAGNAGGAQPGAADVSSTVPAAAAGDASAAMPAQSSATSAGSASGNTVPAAPAADTIPVRSAEDAAKLKAQADAAAASRAAAIARENAKAKAEIEKKAAAGKQAAEDQLALAIQSEAKKGADKKAVAKDTKKDTAAAGSWIVPIGAFSDAAAAGKVAATARKNGVSVSVSQVKTSKGTLTRVTAGPFKSRGEAEVAEGRLAMAGIRAGAVRQAK